RADGGLAGVDGPVRRRRGLGRLRTRAGKSVAPATAHFPASALLCGIRHRPTRRAAGLGQREAGQSQGAGRLQTRPGARRLASVAGIVFRRRLPLRLQRQDSETAGRARASRTGEIELKTGWWAVVGGGSSGTRNSAPAATRHPQPLSANKMSVEKMTP